MKPLTCFPYYGGKSSLIGWLLPLLNTGKKVPFFVDVCCGSASVAINYKHFDRSGASVVINDLNQNIFNFFRTLRDHPDELVRLLELSLNGRDEYEFARLVNEGDDDIEKARKIYVRITQGFGQQAHGNQVWSTGRRHEKKRFNVMGLGKRMRPIIDLLRDVRVENKDSLELIKYYGEIVDNLIYVDPPYPASSRRSTGEYDLEVTDDWHKKLLDVCLNTKANVAVSTYHNPLYDEAFSGPEWNIFEHATYTKFKNTAGKEKQKKEKKNFDRVEVLFTNYQPANREEAFY